MQHCIAANRALVDALKRRFHEDDTLLLAPLAEPDTVGFCFVLVRTYRHLLAAHLDEWLLEDAVRGEVPLVLLRTCIMNPLLHEWNERAPSFAERFADYLHRIARAEYRTLFAL